MQKLSTRCLAWTLALGGFVVSSPARAGKTLDGIKSRGQVACGVHTGLAGFSAADSTGKWSGLDVDVCRAVAAAVLGDPEKVKYVPLTAQQRFTALQSGEIDVLSRNTTLTLTRDASLGLQGTVVTYYDGQGFIVTKKSNIKSPKQLKNQTVCVQSGTTTEKNLTDYSKSNNLNIKTVVFEKEEAATAAYFAGRCVTYTTDASGLASIRNKVATNPADHVILPDVISKEPLGPAVKRGDEAWTSIVRWTLNALVLAEELGVTRENVDQLADNSPDPQIRRLLGVEGDIGPMLGLRKTWAKAAIKAEGNYGEIFDRNVGSRSPLDLGRGLNAQWNAQPAGQMYALPLR